MAQELDAARAALAARDAWLVGGAVRDRMLGRATADLDVVVGDSPQAAARAAAEAAGAACFPLSEEFGAWRVVARDHSWQVDIAPLRADTLEQDLRLRDFTINAIAEPLDGGGTIDPLGGERDLRAGVLRAAGPSAFEDDPLRVLRLVRIGAELRLAADTATLSAARRAAPALNAVSGERQFMELRQIVAGPGVRQALELISELGAGAAVLPELEALDGVEQNRFHHLDVRGHTFEVLERTIDLQRERGWAPRGELDTYLSSHREAVADLLSQPLSDELTRGEALRWGALLHDAAKPLTRDFDRATGRVTFIGHDERGAELARELLGRLRTSERLRSHVAALVRNHLRLGFLVHEPQPLSPRTVFAYLRRCTPVEADVTLLSIADRLATRGEGAERAIARHLELADGVLGAALRWRSEGPPPPLLDGNELAAAAGIAPGPRLGALLEQLAEAQYAGELTDRAGALSWAQAQRDSI